VGWQAQMRSKLLIFILISFCLIPRSQAYVFELTNSGKPIKWSTNSGIVALNYNASNASGLSGAEVATMISSSLAEWNGALEGLDIVLGSSVSSRVDGRNEIVFLDPSEFYFGDGVLAITQTVFLQTTGQILEADIMINDDYTFSSSTSGQHHLGDVLTHEIGHFLGLSHGQAFASSMLYRSFNGQRTITNDDATAAKHLYGSSQRGVIKGRIIGGKEQTGILGAMVSAIGINSGEVIAQAISDASGIFSIKGLKTEEMYYLYVAPANTEMGLSPFYNTARKDFCPGFADYRGSFFETCHKSDQGYPQGILLSSNSPEINVGSVSIKCSLNVPSAYMASKNENTDYEVKKPLVGNGNAMVGFFSASEIASSTADTLIVDLSDTLVTSQNSYAEFRIISQQLFSDVKYSAVIEDGAGNVISLSPALIAVDGEYVKLDLSGRLRLSLTPAHNIFTVTITPETTNSFIDSIDSLFDGSANFQNVFPVGELLLDSTAFYFFSASVSTLSQGQYYLTSHRDYAPLSDNASCAQASNAYQVNSSQPIVSGSGVTTKKSAKDDSLAAAACGSVDMGNGGKGGPLSLCLGLVLAALVCSSRQVLPQFKTRF
jgi:hypothetical protein